MSGLEIERKFLVHKRDDEYKRQAYSSSRIKQGYICSGHGRTVRVRIRDEKGYLTIKGPSVDGGLSRYEFEKEITLDEAEHLMQLCEPGIIDKTRFLVKSGRHHISWSVPAMISSSEPLPTALRWLAGRLLAVERKNIIMWREEKPNSSPLIPIRQTVHNC